MSIKSTNNSIRKNHYYIGFRINPSIIVDLTKSLNYAKQKIISSNKISVKNPVRMFHTRFLYLGYLDNNIANKLIQYLDKLLYHISLNIGLLLKQNNKDLTNICTIESLKVLDIVESSRKYRKIALTYNNSLITNIIVPIIRKLTEDILKKKYTDLSYFVPHINIASINNISYIDDIQTTLDNFNIIFPKSFIIDSIDILRAQNEMRPGKSSKDDDLFVDVVKQYHIRT